MAAIKGNMKVLNVLLQWPTTRLSEQVISVYSLPCTCICSIFFRCIYYYVQCHINTVLEAVPPHNNVMCLYLGCTIDMCMYPSSYIKYIYVYTPVYHTCTRVLHVYTCICIRTICVIEGRIATP